MSATASFHDLDFDVIVEDGAPVEKIVHLLAMMLFRHVAQNRLRELGPDFHVGANQFVCYSVEQARAVAEEERQLTLFERGELPQPPQKTAFRGPDAFVVRGVEPRERDAWKFWEEGERLPDLVLELLSPSTAEVDRGEKKRLYQDVFASQEYFLYEPRGERPEGYRLVDHVYREIPRSPAGRSWSGVLEAEVGLWEGEYDGLEGPWLRLFYPDGRLVLTSEEQERQAKKGAEQRAEQERREKEKEWQAKKAAEQRAEQERREKEKERQAKEAAEIEIARLRARLAELERPE